VRSSPALPLSQGGQEYSPVPEHEHEQEHGDHESVSVLSMGSQPQQLAGGGKNKISSVKKKQQLKKGGKVGSSRSKVEDEDEASQSQPPNMDLLAKFAAERERLVICCLFYNRFAMRTLF
jgi:hypothetical protein